MHGLPYDPTVNDGTSQVQDALRAWIERCIVELTKHHGASPPADIWPEWLREDEEHFVLKPNDAPGWAHLVYEQRETLQGLPEYADCMETLRSDAQIGPQLGAAVGDATHLSRMDPDHILRRLLWSLLGVSDELTFDINTFSKLASQFESELRAEEVQYTLLAPLPAFGFEAEGLPVLLGDLEMAQLSDEEIAGVLSSGLRFDVAMYNYLSEFVGPGNGVRVRYSLPKVVMPLQADDLKFLVEENRQAADAASKGAEDLVEKLISSLRLLKPGAISVTGAVHAHWNRLAGSASFSRSWLRHPQPPRDSYQLSLSDHPALTDLWRDIDASVAHGQAGLQMAIRRFVASGDRHNPEDQLVDLMICAEALFAGDPKYPGDLSYKLALRCSFFLEPGDATARRAVFDQLRRAYGARSNIVHGNRREKRVQKSIEDGLDTLSETERIIRASLRQCLVQASQHATYGFDWDELILGHGE